MKYFPILFFLIAISSCNQLHESKDDFMMNIELGNQKKLQNQLGRAFFYYNKAFVECEKNEVDRKFYAAGKIAEIQHQIADYIGAESTLTGILAEESKVKDKNYTIHIHNELARNFEKQMDYKNALKHYNKALSYIDILSNEHFIIKNNIAVLLIEQKKYNQAKELLNTIYPNKLAQKDTLNFARVMDNLGWVYYIENEKKKALSFFNSALNLRIIKNDSHQLTSSYVHLAKYYSNTNLEKSMEFAYKAFDCSKISKNPDDQLEALDLLLKNANNNEFQKYYTIFKNTLDSVTTIRKANKNEFAKIKWDYTIANKETQIQKNQKIVYLLLFLLTVYGAVHVFITIKKKNKIKLQNASYETETKISKKLHDELANDIHNVMSYVEQQEIEKMEIKVKLLDDLEDIYQGARNISRENSEIDVSEYYLENLKSMILQYENNSLNIIWNTDNKTNFFIDDIKKIQLYRVLQELMINMKKHSKATIVVIKIKEYKKHLDIQYADNGKGCVFENIQKNGLKNVENRIKSIGGSIKFESELNLGFKAKMIIPK